MDFFMATFTNQAAISYNGITVNSNIVTGEITQALAVTKNAVTDAYRTGDTITYVVAIRNTGNVAYTDLILTDNLGAYTVGDNSVTPLSVSGDPVLYYINGVLQSAPTVTAGPPLSITGLRVPANGDAVIVYRVDANEFAPLGDDSEIVNEAVLSGGGLAESITASDTVTADTAPRLVITKAINPAVVNDNGEITYTFTIQNYGNVADASANVTLTDTFNPILDAPLAVTLDDVTLNQPQSYTYSTTTGVFATVPGAITVPAATYTQDPTTGAWTVTPGIATLTVTGTI